MKEEKRSERDLMLWLMLSIRNSGYSIRIRRKEAVLVLKFNGDIYEIRRQDDSN